ncbi:hypothetical protein GCM10009105_10730 [Dokdonella soli]|uniref:Uncharacterized protein n=1 Tax=Dokdonella soli TaxID=529810 RepID=A0ABN1IE14_9GAMM
MLTVCVVGAAAEAAADINRLIDNQRGSLQARWRTGDHASADLLLIDAESVYGHMDWLKAQSSNRLAAAFTTAPEAYEAELWLRKPIAAADLVALLNRVGAGLTGHPPQAAPAPEPVTPVRAAPEPIAAKPEPVPAPPAPRSLQLADLLEANSPVPGLLRLTAEGLPTLLLDPRKRVWHTTATLKALSGWCTRALAENEVKALNDLEFQAAIAATPGEPYARLQWLVHLLRGAGRLEADLDVNARFKLSRWPRSEREFPKHFRIATMMLKQSCTLDEIASESGATIAEVSDFVNAYRAIGFVEQEAAVRPTDDASRSGLFARMKKTSAMS